CYTTCYIARSSPLFLMLPPPPPTSTLFPYTTLFRSHGYRLLRIDWPRRRWGSFQVTERSVKVPLAAQFLESLLGDRVRHVRIVPDRKSTRLNSSHSQISYAVFCLKKKKQQTATTLHS